jgi:hypothetical protein
MDENTQGKESKDIQVVTFDPEALANAILSASAELVERSQKPRQEVDKMIAQYLMDNYGDNYSKNLNVTDLVNDNLGTYDQHLKVAIEGDDLEAKIFWHHDVVHGSIFRGQKLKALEEPKEEKKVDMVKGKEAWKAP